MSRLKCTVSYDGTLFSGYQIQPNKRTVQGDIELALKKIHKGIPTKVHASGRTDAGVHAMGQVFHFDSPLVIPCENWKQALNSLLPEDIVMLKVEQAADDFHARFSVKQKEYRYHVLQTNEKDVFKRNYTYQISEELDISAMQRACHYFIGTHDFTSFCASNTQVKDKVRTIYTFEVIKTGNQYIFSIIGNGFLYQMVRIIIGTVLEVGKGKVAPDQVAYILNKKDRQTAYKTAPANGLFLWHVSY